MITILGLLKANKNLIIYSLIGVCLVLGLYKLYNSIYQSGYNKRTDEYQTAYNLELETQQKEYDDKLAKTIKLMRLENEAALDRQVAKTDIAVRTEKVIQYVDKIVVKTECNDLAVNVVWMLSESTTTINNQAKRTTKSNYKF